MRANAAGPKLGRRPSRPAWAARREPRLTTIALRFDPRSCSLPFLCAKGEIFVRRDRSIIVIVFLVVIGGTEVPRSTRDPAARADLHLKAGAAAAGGAFSSRPFAAHARGRVQTVCQSSDRQLIPLVAGPLAVTQIVQSPNPWQDRATLVARAAGTAATIPSARAMRRGGARMDHLAGLACVDRGRTRRDASLLDDVAVAVPSRVTAELEAA
jgi:hypothetical protein